MRVVIGIATLIFAATLVAGGLLGANPDLGEQVWDAYLNVHFPHVALEQRKYIGQVPSNLWVSLFPPHSPPPSASN
jgi:hypothetical protein